MQRARRSLGLTQRQLAATLGLHWNSIARMERDELPIVKQTELAIGYLLLVKKIKGGKR